MEKTGSGTKHAVVEEAIFYIQPEGFGRIFTENICHNYERRDIKMFLKKSIFYLIVISLIILPGCISKEEFMGTQNNRKIKIENSGTAAEGVQLTGRITGPPNSGLSIRQFQMDIPGCVEFETLDNRNGYEAEIFTPPLNYSELAKMEIKFYVDGKEIYPAKAGGIYQFTLPEKEPTKEP